MSNKKLIRIVGIVGTLICLTTFVYRPSFPTPDKLLIFLTFVFMSFGQATEMLKRLFPFVGLLVVYESFRGLAHYISTNVHYTFMPKFDIWLFRVLPTAQLQKWWWHGSVQWYDFVFYLAYMMHFFVPLVLALLIWKFYDSKYWQFVTSYVILSFSGFLTYAFYPAAPPWMASQKGYIQPITRISSNVWSALGIHDFPSVYNKISPNPVAAVPSLHAAYATLFSIFIFRLFGKKWGMSSLIYPLLIYFGTIYQGEHYVFDALLGIIYAFIAYFISSWLFRKRSKIKIRKLPEN